MLKIVRDFSMIQAIITAWSILIHCCLEGVLVSYWEKTKFYFTHLFNIFICKLIWQWKYLVGASAVQFRERVKVLPGLFIFTVSQSTDALLAVTLRVLSDSSWADTFALSHCLRCSTNKLHSCPHDGRVWERTVCLPLMKLWTIHGRKHRDIPLFPSAVWVL